MYKLLALFAITLSACGAYDPQAWHADSSFTQEERKIITDAEAWASDRMKVPSVGVIFDVPHEDNDHFIKKTIWRRSHEAYWGEDGCKGGATTVLGGKVMFICMRDDQKPYRGALAAHEFAHSMGIHDHLDPSVAGLMNPVPVEMVWTEADQKLCDKCGACQ